jgi:hypothetical protein
MQETDDWRAVHTIGHRTFIGGGEDFWTSIGNLQFELLKSKGLQPSSYLLDIGCGSLRGGQRFIEYLEPDRYLAVDKHIELIIYGVASEIGVDRFREKRPRFVISDSFEFARLGAAPDFAIAQSLFTHLMMADISACLASLRAVAAPGCKFFATFFETQTGSDMVNPPRSHSHYVFHYTRQQMEDAGTAQGWKPVYIGDWNHPRGQHLMQYNL